MSISDDEGLYHRLHGQMVHVLETVPYYRCFGPVGKDPYEMLGKLPVVTKSAIRRAYGDFISDKFAGIRPSLVRSLHEATDPGRMTYEKMDQPGIVIGETSGSTGVPLRCPKSMADRLRLGKGIWWQRSRIDPLVSPDSLYRLTHPSFPSSSAFNPRSDDLRHILALYEDIERSGCRWIHGAPSMLLHHLSLLKAGGVRLRLPNLRFVECSGDLLTQEAKSKIARYFGIEVVDQYGTMETWVISVTCPHGFHHVNDRNVVVEILDEDDRQVPHGVPGRVVVTSLQTKLLPFVRYATSDYGILTRKSCDCDLGSETIRLLEGRDFELIAGLPAPESGTRLFHRAILDVLFEVGHCNLQYIRVFQTDVDEFLVKTNALANAAAFGDGLRRAISSCLDRPVRLIHDLATPEELDSDMTGKPYLFRRLNPPTLDGGGRCSPSRSSKPAPARLSFRADPRSAG